MRQGGCLCGAVRYQAGGTPWHETVCHCTMCRRAAGAPMVGWFTVRRDAFRFVAGEPVRYASSARAERSFCGRCGTALTFESRDLPDELDVTIASLDEPDALPPRDHTRTATQLGWVRLADGLPRFDDARDAP